MIQGSIAAMSKYNTKKEMGNDDAHSDTDQTLSHTFPLFILSSCGTCLPPGQVCRMIGCAGPRPQQDQSQNQKEDQQDGNADEATDMGTTITKYGLDLFD